MVRRIVVTFLKWAAALLTLAGLAFVAFTVHEREQRRRAAEAEADAPVPKRAAGGVVKLGAALAKSHGIADEPARAAPWYARLTVNGRVVPNPSAVAEVRSPFGGVLRADPEHAWPALGRKVYAGQVLGRVDIRAGPQDRLDIQAKLAEALARQHGAGEVLEVRLRTLDRLRKLSSPDVVPARDWDEANVSLSDARTQAAAANAAVDVWRRAADGLKRRDDKAAEWTEVLTAPADGEVTELAARPGVAVEAGGLVARVVDFRRPLVRLDLPPEVLGAGPLPSPVDLFAPLAPAFDVREAADAPPTVSATLVGPAGEVDAATQLAGYWYEVSAPGEGTLWRPGLFVQAHLKAPNARPRDAVVVPRDAVLFHQGRALVYARVGAGRYERREVRLLGREGEQWFLAGGVAAGEPVVVRQAQVLLSEEFRGDVDND